MSNKFKYIFIPNNLKNNLIVLNALKSDIYYEKIIYINNIKEINKFINDYKDKFEIGKNCLLFLEEKGKIFKPCPGTNNLRCCNYTVIDTGINCPFDCHYCFLQFYLNFYVNTLYVNVIDRLQEKENFFRNLKNYLRIGTGEFTDSLVFDDIICYSTYLIDFFEKYKNVVLELKTKSNKIENLLNQKKMSQTVISYSLNTDRIIENIEKKTIPLDERILCLKKISDCGYNVGFHFDPLIVYENCLKEYDEMLTKIFDANINEKKIVWISLGAFRYNSRLKPIVFERFNDIDLFTGEFVQCADEKYRYFQKIRIDMYNFIIKKIRHKYKKVFLYLCMESSSVWKNTLGWFPESDNMLALSFFKR